jgi:hypothetical protein
MKDLRHVIRGIDSNDCHDPQIWLVLVAAMHAVVGVILQRDWNNDNSRHLLDFFCSPM